MSKGCVQSGIRNRTGIRKEYSRYNEVKKSCSRTLIRILNAAIQSG